MAPQGSKQQPKPNSSPVYMDNDPDLTLLIGPTKSQFIVRSSNLSRANPVFKSILSESLQSRSKSSTDPGPWIIKLPNDNPNAASIALGIIHQHSNTVPRYLNLAQIRNVCAFTDKYGMSNILQEWSKTWVASWEASFTGGNPRWVRSPVGSGNGNGSHKGKGGNQEGLDWGVRSRLRRLFQR